MTAADSWFTDPLGGSSDAEWDELAGSHFYCSAYWLRLCALESATGGGVRVEVDGGGRAAVPVARVGFDPHPNVNWNYRLDQAGLPRIAPHGIAVAQIRGYLTHLLTTPGTDRVAAAAAVLAAVRAARTDLDDGVRVGLYLTTPDVEVFRAAGVEAVPVALSLDATVPIPGSRAAWLAAMTGHRSRRIRSEVRRFEAAGYQVSRHRLDEVYADVGRLAAQVQHRYGFDIDVDALVEGFRQHGSFARERAQVLLCRLDGLAVACSVFYRDGDTVYLRAAGFDYQKVGRSGEYTALVFWLPSGLPGVRKLHLGGGSPEAKALRGARLTALWLLDLSENSALIAHEKLIREHNRRRYEGLLEGPAAVAAALEPAEWEAYI
jgi:hypothetical protein